MSKIEWPGTLRARHGYDDRGMINIGIVVYGSLLDPGELWYVFARNRAELVPVRVNGYCRLFNKWVSERLRKPEGDKVAGVLNLRPKDDAWFNGVLVPGVPEPGLEKYAHREQEYDLVRFPMETLEPYQRDDQSRIEAVDAVYACMLLSGENIQNDLEPIPSYLDVCLTGAGRWGESFYCDFLRSTRVKNDLLVDREETVNAVKNDA